MRVHVLHHAACFDGAASSAVFAAFYRAVIDRDAELVYVAKHHMRGDPFVEPDFAADDVAVLDFRYTRHPRLGWYFDHHASSFQLAGEREHYERAVHERLFHDPDARSCTGLVARIAASRFGFDARPHAELLHWAELVDSAAFPDPHVPVALDEPALRLMTFVEQNEDEALHTRFIEDLGHVPLARLARCDYVGDALAPVLHRHTRDVALVGERCREVAGVIEYNLLDQPPRSYNKFIPYHHHPGIRYVVGLSVGPDGRIKLTAGYNPWLPKSEREHDIAALCERFEGGGHPFVGGVSFAPDAEADAIAAQRWIASVLRGERPT